MRYTFTCWLILLLFFSGHTQPNTLVSVLNDGTIYKIAVSEAGVYKLDYDFLKNNLQIDIDNIDPTTLKIYGNGGGIIPEAISDSRKEDLVENAIFVAGEEDGSFDTGDYLLFYGEGAHQWQYRESTGWFDRITNIYDRNNYYFLKISPEKGKRIATQSNLENTEYTTTAFTDYQRQEDELVNLLDDFASAQGTGKDWYGDLYEVRRAATYADFDFPNLLTDEPANLQVAFAGRGGSNSTVYASVDGNRYAASIRRTDLGDIEDTYAHIARINNDFLPTTTDLSVDIEYPATGGNIGWLDYIQLNVRRQLIMSDEMMSFSDPQTLDYNSSTFVLDGTDNQTVIWDISDPLQPFLQEVKQSGTQLSFGVMTNQLKKFIAFTPNADLLTPANAFPVNNQNIHAIEAVDMLIVYHRNFEQAAMQLAEHRRSFNQFKVETVLIDQVFNEFSSGRVDPTAIRDLAKMCYERSDRFKYLLLFGDGSFDYKNIKNLPEPSNYIPVYETDESLHPINGFPTDDYYALLSDNEGDNLRGALDIAVGRLPVKTAGEADAVVKKIINYETNPATLGDWRLRQTFIADDEDRSIHQRQANDIATKVDTVYDDFNVNKIFLDAFQQIVTPGGQRYPAVKEAINQDVFRGMLVMNYLGHGGPKGWTQERVLEIGDILSWTNFNQLPLIITATCSFTGYDDPDFVTAGEHAVLNPSGGAIALFTTVRAVYSSSNERLTKAVFDQLYEKVDGEQVPIGESLRLSKNSNSSDTTGINARKFTLIGDPAIQLTLPKQKIITSAINQQPVSEHRQDTLRALESVTVSGFIADDNGEIDPHFNGKLYTTVFDKKSRVSNLGNDPRSTIRPFDIQKNVLFKGVARVENGEFKFTFVIPKDINYQFGNGKISYYAENGTTDASGSYEKIIIGGTSTNAPVDLEGPEIGLFLNDTTFVSGGTTGPRPTLLVYLSDESGINVSGTSIGHDLTAVLNDDTQNKFSLNDFYESITDDFRQGIARFPLNELEEGQHQITVKAWDVHNNSSEATVDFLVSTRQTISLSDIINFPNPFEDETTFRFKHNLTAGQPVEVQIRIYSVNGQLVKTLTTSAASEGQLVSGISWQGDNESGLELGKGIYFYQIQVRPSGSSGAVTTENNQGKLIIIR